jgi:hypothetical protein
MESRHDSYLFRGGTVAPGRGLDVSMASGSYLRNPGCGEEPTVGMWSLEERRRKETEMKRYIEKQYDIFTLNPEPELHTCEIFFLNTTSRVFH